MHFSSLLQKVILCHHTSIAWHQSYFYKELKLKLKTAEIAVIYDFFQKLLFHYTKWNTVFLLKQYSGICSLIYGLLFTKWNYTAHQFSCCIKLFKTWHCSYAFFFGANYAAFFLVDWKIVLRITVFLMVLPHRMEEVGFHQPVLLSWRWSRHGHQLSPFFAVSDGRGAHDGTGGTVKRLARKASR